MTNSRKISVGATLLRLSVATLVAFAFFGRAAAQTPGGTTISNQASATYSDGTNSYSTVSNTVTVTVSNVSGIAITPDTGSYPTTVVAGQTGLLYDFTVSNTGNFTDQVRFLASGASVRVFGPGTITRAVIDLNSDGDIDAGETDIFTNAADVVSANIAQNGSIRVLVEVSVGSGATAGQTVQVVLGDAGGSSPYDNQASDGSQYEVRTVSAASVNGLREAKGDISATVANDALLQLSLTAPPGPVALGSDISYAWQVCNNGARDASGVTLNGSTQVYIIAPIPARTVLKSGQTFPAGTLYADNTTSPLTVPPLSATWSTTPPSPLSNTSRVAFPVGATLAAGGACSASINMVVTVNTGIDASVPIDEIGDAFGKNSINTTITDQSGDNTPNNGDTNADFNEGYVAGAGHGVIQRTLLSQVGSVLIGPSGAPGALGPGNDNNLDYTNKSVNTGIAGIQPGGVTNDFGQIIFVNTVQNTGNTADTFTLDAPSVPAGFTVEISTDGGTNYTTVSGGGSTSLAIAYGASANINVRITEPAGNTVLTGFDTVIRATSTVTPAANNGTIDRLYTGFVRLVKSVSVSNGTGVGGATDAVPGAVITYNIAYENISTSDGDANCVKLTAQNLIITEDGIPAPGNTNNWGNYTTHVAASDSGTGVVVVVGPALYTDTIASLAPGASAIFTFQRSIN